MKVPPLSSGGVIAPAADALGERGRLPRDVGQPLGVGVEERRHEQRVVAGDDESDVDARVQLEAPVAVGAVDARVVAQRQRGRLQHQVVERRLDVVARECEHGAALHVDRDRDRVVGDGRARLRDAPRDELLAACELLHRGLALRLARSARARRGAGRRRARRSSRSCGRPRASRRRRRRCAVPRHVGRVGRASPCRSRSRRAARRARRARRRSFSQRRMVPSSIESDSRGITTSGTRGRLLGAAQAPPRRRQRAARTGSPGRGRSRARRGTRAARRSRRPRRPSSRPSACASEITAAAIDASSRLAAEAGDEGAVDLERVDREAPAGRRATSSPCRSRRSRAARRAP